MIGVTPRGAQAVALCAFSVCPHSSAKQIQAARRAATLLPPATDTVATARSPAHPARWRGGSATEPCNRVAASPATPWSHSPSDGTSSRSAPPPGPASTADPRRSQPRPAPTPAAPSAGTTARPTTSDPDPRHPSTPTPAYRRQPTPAATDTPTSSTPPAPERPPPPVRPQRTTPPPADVPAAAEHVQPGPRHHHRRTAYDQHTPNQPPQSITQKPHSEPGPDPHTERCLDQR